MGRARAELPDQSFSAAERGRLHDADLTAYRGLYQAAAPVLGTGSRDIDGALAMWNPHDEDPSFNYLTGFERVSDPDGSWQQAESAARAGGARVFGVGLTEERLAWAAPERMERLGLRYDSDEIVWAAHLSPGEIPPPRPLPEGIELISDGVDPAVFARVLNRGWQTPEGHGRGRLYAAAIGLPGWTHYLSLADGLPAGGSVLFTDAGVSIFMVAATDPLFRGRGIQTALIGRRLDDAAAAGSDLLMTETVASNASPRNFERAGFAEIARRRIYAKRLDSGGPIVRS